MAAPSEKWKLKIKTLNADTFQLEIDANATVEQLKQKIKESNQVSLELQRLIFRGKILKMKKKLKDYNLCNGATVHLIVRKPNTNIFDRDDTNSQNSQNANNNPPSSSTTTNTAPSSNGNTANTAHTANASNPAGNRPFINIQNLPAPQAAAMQSMHQMFQNMASNLNQQRAQQLPAGGVPIAGMPGMPPMIIRRMPMNHHTATTTNIGHQHHDDDDDGEDKQELFEDGITIKKAEYATEIDDDKDASSNLLKWKIKRSRMDKWINSGPKYAVYFSESFECNNDSIWKLFLYPNGINQDGYHDNCVLFVLLEELPFGVDAMDVEFIMHYKPHNVNFKFRKIFNHLQTSAGWPRNFLTSQKVLQLPDSKQFVKFSCDLVVHSVMCQGRKMSNAEYMQWKHKATGCDAMFALKGNEKPNGKVFRWKLSKKLFTDAQFKQYKQSKMVSMNGFAWYIQIYPNGLTRDGYVQPYLHLVKLPKYVGKIDAHFSFFLPDLNLGYNHVDAFNGKMGKGWPDTRLKTSDIEWPLMKEKDTLCIECRVNILGVSVNHVGWFLNYSSSEKRADIDRGNNDGQQEEKQSNDDANDDDEDDEDEGDAERHEFKKWLQQQVGLGQYFERFVENEIHSLSDIVEYIESRTNLIEIGIKPFAHNAKLWKHIVKLKDEMQMSFERDHNDNDNDNIPTEF